MHWRRIQHLVTLLIAQRSITGEVFLNKLYADHIYMYIYNSTYARYILYACLYVRIKYRCACLSNLVWSYSSIYGVVYLGSENIGTPPEAAPGGGGFIFLTFYRLMLSVYNSQYTYSVCPTCMRWGGVFNCFK